MAYAFTRYPTKTTIRAGLHHELWSRTMEDVLFSWSDSMVQLSWFHFTTISNYKAFGPLTRCKPDVDQEEWPCTKKWMCGFVYYMSIKENFERKCSRLTILFVFYCLHLLFLKCRLVKIFIIIIFLCHGSLFFYQSTYFCFSHCKTHWIMSMDNVGRKICLWSLSLFFSFVWTEVIPWWVPQPILYFTRP